MSKEQEFNFLRVKNGRPYFARVSVVADLAIQGVQVLQKTNSHDSHFPQSWLDAAFVGATMALDRHLQLGGNKIGVVINWVLGTEVDTTTDSVETAAYLAAWKALGHQESELDLDFDERWQIKFAQNES